MKNIFTPIFFCEIWVALDNGTGRLLKKAPCFERYTAFDTARLRSWCTQAFSTLTIVSPIIVSSSTLPSSSWHYLTSYIYKLLSGAIFKRCRNCSTPQQRLSERSGIFFTHVSKRLKTEIGPWIGGYPTYVISNNYNTVSPGTVRGRAPIDVLVMMTIMILSVVWKVSHHFRVIIVRNVSGLVTVVHKGQAFLYIAAKIFNRTIIQ